MLSVSRLEANKRIDWILKALAELDSSGSLAKTSWVLEIIGHGPAAESLKKLAEDLGLADQILFLGHLRDADLMQAYARTNLFIMPAMQGYGLPALEALKRGIPVIVHKDSGVSEILNGSPWAELVDGDNTALPKAILNILDRIKATSLSVSEMPEVPTNSEWAREVCIVCDWLPGELN